MKQPDNKKTTLKAKGNTDDIIKSVVSVFKDSYQQAAEIAPAFKGATIRETAANVADFVVKNFKYKIDPDGEQWIRTPARLYADREADCKSFSIFVCSVLSCLGIKNGFRFVSYTPDKQITHVYSYAFDEQGDKFIIDTVAQIQRGLPVFEEIKYCIKKDVNMNNYTHISKLSGLAGSELASEDEIRTLSASDSGATIFVKSLIFKARVMRESKTVKCLQSLLFITQNYGDDRRKYGIAIYTWIGLFLGDEISPENQIKIIKTNITEIGKNPNYTIDAEFVNSDDYKNVANWVDVYLTPYIDYYVAADPMPAVDLLNENAFNFLYLFVDKKYLTKRQIAKRNNEAKFLDIIISNTAINTAAALNMIYCFSTMNFGDTPQNVLAAMFNNIPFDLSTPGVGAADEGDGVIKIDSDSDKSSGSLPTSSNTQQNKNKSSDIMSWINTAVDSFIKVFGAVKNGSNAANNGVTPYPTDATTSGPSAINMLLVGGLLLGGFAIVSSKKNNKKKK